MKSPKVSVIIPTYNGAKFLEETIQSVLAQTYSNFEIILVNDASPDNTTEVVSQFDDPRLKYIVHDKNQGSDIARNTGLKVSSGEVIVLLDQDDFFHPEKLQKHVAFLENHHEIGFTYNARFELNYSSNTIRGIWRPPRTITLADLVLWFPISPSDAVLRREWALQMDLVGGTRGAEIYHFSQLFMAGCKFACIDQALNYRRYHSGRTIKDLSGSCESEINNQVKVFSDPRCPSEVLTLQDTAHANIYKYWAYIAFAQDETIIGQKFIREAVRLQPSILGGNPCSLVTFFITNCIDDENIDHSTLLHRLFNQLPPEMDQISEQYPWAVARGYLIKGLRAILWNRAEDGRRHFEQAERLYARFDEALISQLTQNLLDYEMEFGPINVQNKIRDLTPYIEKFGGQASVQRLIACYSLNRAFQSYNDGQYAKVPEKILHAIANNYKYLANRGVMSIFLHSMVEMVSNSKSASRQN